MYMPGNCGQWPSPRAKLKVIVRDMRKIMGDGCWLQFPQRLREPGPGSVLSLPPPPPNIVFVCAILGRIFNPFGLVAKFVNLCGRLALFISIAASFMPRLIVKFLCRPSGLLYIYIFEK
jgi:hypothetical protein